MPVSTALAPALLTCLALGCLAIAGCAPAASLPPPVPLPAGQRYEVGLGLSASRFVESTPTMYDHVPVLDLQAWYLVKATRRVDLGVQAYGGMTSLVGGGAMARLRVVDTPDVSLGLQAEGGWLWWGVGLPMTARLTPKVSIYTNPTYAVRAFNPLRLPAGVVFNMGPRSRLTVELGMDFGTTYAPQYILHDAIQYITLANSGSF